MVIHENRIVSMPTLRRLTAYHPYIKGVEDEGRETISCTHIATHMGIDPTQVRKDIEATGIIGKPKVGYDVHALRLAIEDFLEWNNPSKAFLIGAGNLGAAILGYGDFVRYGLDIVAAFDRDPSRIGTQIHDKPILSMEKLPGLARRMRILVGIITTPAPAAQDVANILVASGIRGIWNFAPTALSVPPGVVIETVSLAASLAVLSNRLARTLKEGDTRKP